MSLRVLIVEDDDMRMQIFDLVFEHDDVWRAKTAARGIKLLGEHRFDLVMLDHDLEDADYGAPSVHGREGTGQDVARAIAAMGEPPPVLIHSWNPDGARVIAAILAEARVPARRAPFGQNTERDVALFREWMTR